MGKGGIFWDRQNQVGFGGEIEVLPRITMGAATDPHLTTNFPP